MPKGLQGFQKGHPDFTKGRAGFKKGNIPWNKLNQSKPIIICACGCKNQIKLYTYRRAASNYKKRGFPRFIQGHSSRVSQSMSNPISREKMIKTKNTIAFKTKLSETMITMFQNPIIKAKHDKNIPRGKDSPNKRPERIAQSTGKNNGMYGRSPEWHRIIYNNIQFKSTWEVEYAKFFDLNGIIYIYEYNTFSLGNKTYTPDFYFPVQDKWLEVKGWEWHNKFEEWLRQNPSIQALKIKGITEIDKNKVLTFIRGI